jgi:hypothetical protein
MKTNPGQDRFSEWLEKSKLWVGSLVLFAGFLIGVGIIYVRTSLVGIGVMGIWILLTMLIAGNILSKGRDLSSAEVRRSIAVSVMSVFFGLLAVGGSIKVGDSILQPILENFWWIVITVIGFYFGGRSAEKIVETISKKWTESAGK